jgi:hypothetical protein
LIEIPRAGDGETGTLQRGSDQPGIVGRRCELSCPVLVVANHQSKTPLSRLGGLAEGRRDQEREP